MATNGPLGIEGFNHLSERQRMHLLFDVCSSPIWARRVLAGGPFRDDDALLDRADRVLAELPDAEVDAALDGHPRIGASVSSAHSPSSAQEQARVADADAAVKAELAEKNRRYEDAFGYVYLVCASGRTAEELLAILNDRLDNDPDTERRVMRSELAKINRLRLSRLLSKETV
ncbi:2-oxo-4-hydroxy-4-carboxy-5-ureidoimidazoline decarboxylase [Mycolicibacterium hippocampi]|uniref:2-oxo-4-hydroxy-4-carboxy-5-ureidoimidazoline decarboxylase n=1 Tax=Mycolicibacterium hippocampi TaxID=659824 RepID=A0A850PV17_9MYCO|nr:2-oxo-4-hydroxy-4-carboxy-5-ureidoimidazoline decarboxylase [Mycolicibacterium hippocampi]NVN51844.1 2-oxo-4-hydroxy-4-carboxy-5-ureidoimidazoline (OHCU) decarboxylase [Mycolicibacterium hippocampi]